MGWAALVEFIGAAVGRIVEGAAQLDERHRGKTEHTERAKVAGRFIQHVFAGGKPDSNVEKGK